MTGNQLYMDHHVESAITKGLREREVDVLTAFEDESHRLPDSALLDRATTLGRILFTRDDDLLVEAHRRQSAGIDFAGVIFADLQRVPIGMCIRDLELIAKTSGADELQNQVRYLPL